MAFSLFLISDGKLRGATSWTKGEYVHDGFLIVPGPNLASLSLRFKDHVLTGVEAP
jgi:hypothetical protein